MRWDLFLLYSEMLKEQAGVLCRAIIQINEGKYFMLVMKLHYQHVKSLHIHYIIALCLNMFH